MCGLRSWVLDLEGMFGNQEGKEKEEIGREGKVKSPLSIPLSLVWIAIPSPKTPRYSNLEYFEFVKGLIMED